MALTNFDGAVAVITGGAGGIGLATAHALRAKGAHIVLADVNPQALQAAQEQLQQHQPNAPGKITGVAVDVTNETQVQDLMQQTASVLGRIDLVVTCAGIGRGGPIDLFTGEEMQQIMNINYMGTYFSIRAALPIMRQQQGGHFVLLSSLAGKLGSPLLSAYCATKWAVRGLAIALRAELYSSNIGITTVYPSWVDTPMIHQDPAAAQLLNINAAMKPEQVADAIVQAIADNKRDLTLVPDQEGQIALQLMKDDPDKAEDLIGMAFQQRLQQLSGTPQA